MIILPAGIDIVSRWQKCHERNSLLMWRATAFLCSSAALVAKTDGDTESEQNCMTLFELAMQHVFDLYPAEEAA